MWLLIGKEVFCELIISTRQVSLLITQRIQVHNSWCVCCTNKPYLLVILINELAFAAGYTTVSLAIFSVHSLASLHVNTRLITAKNKALNLTLYCKKAHVLVCWNPEPGSISGMQFFKITLHHYFFNLAYIFWIVQILLQMRNFLSTVKSWPWSENR